MKLLYARPSIAVTRGNSAPDGLGLFSHFFDLFNWGLFPVDRTGTIRFPVLTTSLFPLPDPTGFSKTYEDICNERARSLLERMDELGCGMYVFWSGGIDSTLVLVSLLKNASRAQRERIVVLLSQESIAENPDFYDDHIRGVLRAESSMQFPYFVGTKNLIVSGEHNDQVFGSGAIGRMIQTTGADVVHRPYSRELFSHVFAAKIPDPSIVTFYLDMFERLKDAAPVPVVSNFDYLWWINFALKWQTVYFRSLSYVSAGNRPRVTQAYVQTFYQPFYNTEDFQCWSMNNPDKKMKDEWNTYKWPCKDIIFAYDKNQKYRDTKVKRNSLKYVTDRQRSFPFIDENWHFHDALGVRDYYDPDSDFSLRADPPLISSESRAADS